MLFRKEVSEPKKTKVHVIKVYSRIYRYMQSVTKERLNDRVVGYKLQIYTPRAQNIQIYVCIPNIIE